jgi:hypothetical protein
MRTATGNIMGDGRIKKDFRRLKILFGNGWNSEFPSEIGNNT